MGEADVVIEIGVTTIIILAVFSLLLTAGPLTPPGGMRYLILVSLLVTVTPAAGVNLIRRGQEEEGMSARMSQNGNGRGF